jgi:DNA topoisomerase I
MPRRGGWRRLGSKKRFRYVDAKGRPITDEQRLERIRALAIPPAWTDVWISPWPNGHLQATGRDARGRKQYRYHADWAERRGAEKYERMLGFARVLPRLRRRVDRDLRRRGLPRDKVLAAVVRLLELTLIRVGNDEYARLNRSFGLTTLRDRHADVRGASVRFRFRAKSGAIHESGLRDRRLATIVRQCQELPGQDLFQYVDDRGDVRDVASDDVNEYIREATGGDYSAKDVRTWAGTVLAFRALRALEPADHEPAARRNLVEAIRAAAQALGNTPAVARGSYVHPAVPEAYLEGALQPRARRAKPADVAVRLPDRNEELALLRVLKERPRGETTRLRTRAEASAKASEQDGPSGRRTVRSRSRTQRSRTR